MQLIAIYRHSTAGKKRKTHASRVDVIRPLCGGGNGAAGQLYWDQDIQSVDEACSCLKCLQIAVKMLTEVEPESQGESQEHAEIMQEVAA